MRSYHRVCFIYICDVFTCYCWNHKKKTFNEIWVWSRQTANETRSADSFFPGFLTSAPWSYLTSAQWQPASSKSPSGTATSGLDSQFFFLCPQASPQQGWQILRGMKCDCEHGLKSLDGRTLTPSICDAETHERGIDFRAVGPLTACCRTPSHSPVHTLAVTQDLCIYALLGNSVAWFADGEWWVRRQLKGVRRGWEDRMKNWVRGVRHLVSDDADS